MPTKLAHPATRIMLALAGMITCALLLPVGSLGAATVDRSGSSNFASVTGRDDDSSDAATGETIEFTSSSGAGTAGVYGGFGGIDLGFVPPPKLGIEQKRLTFVLTPRDRKALEAARRAEKLRIAAEKAYGVSADATARILAIETLLSAAEHDEQQLRELMSQRAVDRYKAGSSGDLAFLLEGDGISDLIDRTRVLNAQARSDKANAEQLALTTARLDELRFALEDLRDQQGDRAVNLHDRADRLDGIVASAQVAHMEAVDPRVHKHDGPPGQWYVMDGAFDSALFMPLSGDRGWGGGTRTPRRPPTPEQIMRVLSDPRIELDASGVGDVRTGQIDGRLLDALTAAAMKFGKVKVTSLKSDHGTYTSSGNISAHSFGCAADIGTIGSTYITGASQVPGGEVEQAVRFLSSLPGDLAPHQVISLFDIGGASMSMGDHHDHIHLGYSC